ncbi:ROK family transcriptional regulator [Kribbella sp. VKM Ac-2568]|uniref:ROK family transcriptional regulator n=1 Tax=Kribbella sp. VKM Ac-2568 TaxID=2512219 RepID=UPI00104B829D|nr:ROK family transcriptional regulator [Kribbella sp. VKM Ac-2568]TCM48791.1 putative NBD/HSP70 family sugar kinase [Kribbella sp. VKM Ac-2568]
MGAGAWQPLTGPSHQLALEILLDGPLSRAELARRVDLSAGSLTRLTKPMLESGLLVEVSGGPTDPRVGRPSQPLDIVPASHHFVGVKLTADAALGVVTTLRAEVIATEERPLPDHSPEVVADVVVELERSLAAGVPGITGLGVSLGGHITSAGDVLRGDFLAWFDVPFRRLLAERTDAQVVVSNDVTAVTEAIHWFGAGRGVSRFCLLTIGAGIGYGLVVHDKLVDTTDVGLGLVGHVQVDPDGPLCDRGHRGCASAMLTTEAITSQVGTALGRRVEYDECLDLAKDGVPEARRVISTAGHALGRLIAAATNFTMPEAVMLGGEGVRLASVAHEQVLAGIRSDRHPEAAIPPLVLQDPTFAQWARGAAVIAIQTFVLGR